MKLRYLKIAQFKNLRDFEISFGLNPFTTVLLGQNGAGKSNLLEALIIIFRNLDLGASPEFSYTLDYECRGNKIHIQADLTLAKREQVQIHVGQPDGPPEKISYNRFWQDPQRTYLPSYVFGYYSGPSNRMEKHFDQHQNRLYQGQLKGERKQRRPLFYARSVQNQFALLAFFTEEEKQEHQTDRQSARQFLKDLLGIEKLVSVYFILHEPPWTSKDGDARFWNARGVLGEFLAHLYNVSLAPRRQKERVVSDFSSSNLEHLYCFLRDEQALKKLFANYGNQRDFFNALESTYISRVLSEVRIRLKRSGVDEPLTFNEMSEGEQQLLMVLGLLRFTKEDEALFLLDEPDTHLNPAWSVQYFDFMKQAVGDLPTSHVIMTTHNPLVVSALKREDVRIMQRQGKRILAEKPREDPQGMGVSNILTSELFGLRTTLDWPTQKKLDRQRELAARERITEQEEQELQKLTQEMDEMGFQLGEDDEIYAAFLKKWFAREDPGIREQAVLTPEQQEAREKMVEEIVKELIVEGHWR